MIHPNIYIISELFHVSCFKSWCGIQKVVSIFDLSTQFWVWNLVISIAEENVRKLITTKMVLINVTGSPWFIDAIKKPSPDSNHCLPQARNPTKTECHRRGSKVQLTWIKTWANGNVETLTWPSIEILVALGIRDAYIGLL